MQLQLAVPAVQCLGGTGIQPSTAPSSVLGNSLILKHTPCAGRNIFNGLMGSRESSCRWPRKSQKDHHPHQLHGQQIPETLRASCTAISTTCNTDSNAVLQWIHVLEHPPPPPPPPAPKRVAFRAASHLESSKGASSTTARTSCKCA